MLSVFLLTMSAVFFWLGWIIFCLTRGYSKLNMEQRTGRIKYQLDEIYDIGNPFSQYTGRTN